MVCNVRSRMAPKLRCAAVPEAVLVVVVLLVALVMLSFGLTRFQVQATVSSGSATLKVEGSSKSEKWNAAPSDADGARTTSSLVSYYPFGAGKTLCLIADNDLSDKILTDVACQALGGAAGSLATALIRTSIFDKSLEGDFGALDSLSVPARVDSVFVARTQSRMQAITTHGSNATSVQLRLVGQLYKRSAGFSPRLIDIVTTAVAFDSDAGREQCLAKMRNELVLRLAR